MFFSIIIGIALGIIAGIITGLTPGIHVNLVATIALIMSPMLPFSPATFVFFLLSLALTHSFLDTIPSVFLGIPDSDTLIAALPGHKLAMHGHGYEAVKMTLLGSYGSLLLIILLSPLFLYFIPMLHYITQTWIVLILLFFLLMSVWKESTIEKKVWSLIILGLSGILGYVTLQSYHLQHPFFHLFSGLFGISSLYYSLGIQQFPKQYITDHDYSITSIISPTIASIFGGTITGIIPGIGNAHASMIAFYFTKFKTQTYMILQGGINTTSMIISLLALATIQKARNGMIIVLQSFVFVQPLSLLLLLSALLFVGSLNLCIALSLAKKFVGVMEKIPYNPLCISLICFLCIISLVLDSFLGFVTLTVSTFIGLLPIYTQTKRSTTMACLLIPLLVYLVFP